MTDCPMLTLNNGVQIPQVGFGVFQVEPAVTAASVRAALDAGYRHIDTARLYKNEREVGQAVRESGLAREDVFVTTKCWNTDQGYDAALTAFDRSMERLDLEYVDLYLIHWPLPVADKYVETWRAFEQILADGRARAIGVSNFQVPHLRRLAGETDVVPAVNQIELHPWLSQEALRTYHAEHGIITQAWSPLARGGDFLNDPVLTEIAGKHGRTTAQVMLRWSVQLGNVVLPRTTKADRAASNIALFDFELDADDLARIATLNTDTRIGPNPDEFAAGA